MAETMGHHLSTLICISSADPDFKTSDVPVENLPRCQENGCGGLLRPHIVWFGENLDSAVLDKARMLFSLFKLAQYFTMNSFSPIFIIRRSG